MRQATKLLRVGETTALHQAIEQIVAIQHMHFTAAAGLMVAAIHADPHAQTAQRQTSSTAFEALGVNELS